ncbi:hypothetical protein BofuT4_uP127390.1 [Botrytis cinerea T4]|uniref:Uncharacterized protein n=1 Tax=Botryotinia fuckeliana (strain T4) TaxID=999810 RepID=G2YSU3_BOTF4|nr:hypothetical protein BofuT4_uP127390.1 [Botrytis cinerea T4]
MIPIPTCRLWLSMKLSTRNHGKAGYYLIDQVSHGQWTTATHSHGDQIV